VPGGGRVSRASWVKSAFMNQGRRVAITWRAIPGIKPSRLLFNLVKDSSHLPTSAYKFWLLLVLDHSPNPSPSPTFFEFQSFYTSFLISNGLKPLSGIQEEHFASRLEGIKQNDCRMGRFWFWFWFWEKGCERLLPLLALRSVKSIVWSFYFFGSYVFFFS
jgi:hypothetical protein